MTPLHGGGNASGVSSARRTVQCRIPQPDTRSDRLATGMPMMPTAPSRADGSAMSEHTYKLLTLVGSSHASIEGAVQNAIARAAIEEKHLRWFEVVETRGQIEDGKIAHWQVQVKIGATQDE